MVKAIEKERVLTIELNGKVLSKTGLRSLRFENVSIPIGDIFRGVRDVLGAAEGCMFFRLSWRLANLLPPPPDRWHDRIFGLALTYGEHHVFMSCQSLPVGDILHLDNTSVEVGVYFQTPAQPFNEFVNEWRRVKEVNYDAQ